MMQIQSKWRIEFVADKQVCVLYINDNFYQNVLRKLADISFDTEPTKIEISLVKGQPQNGVFSG